MKRREFFVKSSMGAAASSLVLPFGACTPSKALANGTGMGKKAKNIIFMVSDGMSTGTLNMAELLLKKKEGRNSNWLDLYRNQRVSRALMDMASASSMVTDSAAASSSWGGGVRVKNGHLNTGPAGEEYMPIWQKFKKSGKKVGCVTTVPITHATPAGFCVNQKTRGEQAEIAVKYLNLRFDVMMGGGEKHFIGRKDGRDMYNEFRNAGFQVVNTKTAMLAATSSAPVLGVFDKDGLPYEVDRVNDETLKAKVPSLAEMTEKAISLMKSHPAGFCLQVEGGKVDWAAHGNDAAALIYDQIAFDEAIKVAIDFAEKDGNTLVIITTDHGNSNPGLYYGDDADKNFARLFTFRHSNEFILQNMKIHDTTATLTEKVMASQGYSLTPEQAIFIMDKYKEQASEGVYNVYKLPFKEYAMYQAAHTSVAFGGMDHSGDYVELAMFGPGSEMLKPFMVNTEMHTFMLRAAEVENKF